MHTKTSAAHALARFDGTFVFSETNIPLVWENIEMSAIFDFVHVPKRLPFPPQGQFDRKIQSNRTFRCNITSPV
jgi:hypothetical protein